MIAFLAVVTVKLSLAQVGELSPPPPPLVEAGRECLAPSDCGEGSTCDAGRCRVWCSTLRDCGAGLVCSGHQQRPDGQWTKGLCRAGLEGEPCRERGQCGRGFVCAGPPVAGSESSCTTTSDAQGLERLDRGTDGSQRYRYRGDVPAGFQLVSQPISGLVVAGSVAFGVAYALPIVAGAFNSDASGLIPLIGPFLVAGNAWSSGAWSGFGNFFLALGAVVSAGWQGVGIGMLLGGFLGGQKWLEPARTVPSVSLVPGSAGSLVGASVVGRF